MNGTYTQRRKTQMAGGGIMTQIGKPGGLVEPGIMNYGAFDFITDPIKKVGERVRKLIPNEIANVAAKAAPFVAPFNPLAAGIMRGVGRYDKRGDFGDALKQGLLTYGGGKAAGYGLSQIPTGAGGSLATGVSSVMDPTKMIPQLGTENVFKTGFTKALNFAKAPFKALKGMSKGEAMLTVGAIGAGASYVIDKLVGPKDPGETMQEYNRRRKSTMSEYLRYYYKNVNPLASEEEVANFVATNTREYSSQGGRIGYQTGGLSEPDWYAGSSIAMPGTAWDEEYSGLSWDQLSPYDQQRILDIYDPSDEPSMTVEDWQGMIPGLGRPTMGMPMGPNPTEQEAREQFQAWENATKTATPQEHLSMGLHAGPGMMPPVGPVPPASIRGGSLGSRIRPAVSRVSQAAPEGLPYVAMQNTLAQNIAANRAQQQATQGMFEAARARLPGKKGGRIGYALGGFDAGAPSITYGGLPTIPGTPKMAPDGLEYDMSQNGGFQPLGAQEGKDDIKANLAKNEFVFTADAVRGAGDGDIETGAQRMYDTMKRLEGRVA